MAIVTKIAFLAVCLAAVVGEDASPSEDDLLEKEQDVSEDVGLSTGQWPSKHGKHPSWYKKKHIHIGGRKILKKRIIKRVIHRKIIHKVVKILSADQARIHEVTQQVMKEGVSGTPIGTIKEGFAEFFGTFVIVFITVGTAMSVPDQSHKLIHLSLVAGLVYTVTAYAVGHYSGAQLNAAVTLGIQLTGHISAKEALIFIAFQCLGSYCGAFALTFIFSAEADETKPHFLHTPHVQSGWAWWQAYLGEFICTALVVYTYVETVANPDSKDNRAEAYLALGLMYFAAHCILLPVDGCCVNPSRSFGPTVVRRIFRQGGKMAYLSQLWIFWTAPLLGSAFAASLYMCVHQRQMLEHMTAAA
jgi:MIP family channel proteins